MKDIQLLLMRDAGQRLHCDSKMPGDKMEMKTEPK